jgi:hypothetical protein
MNNTRILHTMAAALALFVSTVRGQNLILDGSFESPAELTPGTYLGVTPADWTGGYRLFRGDGNMLDYPAPEQGDQYEGLAGKALSQTFNVTQGGEYLLTWYGDSVFNDDYAYLVTITGGSGIAYSNIVNGVGGPVWAKETALVNLAPGSDTLTFISANGADGSRLIDNVSLVAVAPDATGTQILLPMAIGGLAICSRKFRRRD